MGRVSSELLNQHRPRPTQGAAACSTTHKALHVSIRLPYNDEPLCKCLLGGWLACFWSTIRRVIIPGWSHTAVIISFASFSTSYLLNHHSP